MAKPLCVLIVEDSEDDARIVLRELRHGGYDPVFERVETREAMKAALIGNKWDIVLSDHSMPYFGSSDALVLLQESGLDLPFIIVSSRIGEEVAVASMKAGAHDYVMKGNLSRLVPVIERELREAEVRREQKQAEEELQKTHAELQRAYEELKEIDHVKSDIIGNVSHELRTPLSIARGMMELAGEEENKEARNLLLKSGINALWRQNEIIENLLTLARLSKEEYKLETESIMLNQAVTLASKRIESLALERDIGVEMDLKDELVVKADYKALGRVLHNLLDNAVKFNKKGGKVVVEAKRTDSMAEICVADTGIGIPNERLHKLFQPLTQIESSMSRHYSGTGTGLSVVKGLVEAMGGTVDVESELGKGSKFYFTVPMTG